MGLVIGMFTSVRIQNFRQFRDLQLDGLAQINLITGKNNTGKTSLLEALNVLIAPNSPDVLLTHARLRGMDHVASDGSHAWGFVFYDGQFDRTIVMEATNVDKSSPVLRIRAAKDLDATFLTDVGSNGAGSQHTIPTTTSVATGLEYVYESDVGEGSEPKISRIIQSGRRWHVERADLPKVHPWYFRAQRPADIGKATGDDTARPHEFEVEAQRFSQLVLMRRKLEVVEAVRVIEPRVTDLMVLDLPPPTIAADIGLRTLVPMNYLGSGFGNMLKLVLGMLLVPGGTMFIDEVEDGFHYSTLTDVWRVIVETAIKHSVQVFATTHSYECLEAAVKASEGHEGSLAFYRLDRREDGIEVVAGEDSRLRSAIRIGAEIR